MELQVNAEPIIFKTALVTFNWITPDVRSAFFTMKDPLKIRASQLPPGGTPTTDPPTPSHPTTLMTPAPTRGADKLSVTPMRTPPAVVLEVEWLPDHLQRSACSA
jgi:hypothetical protein